MGRGKARSALKQLGIEVKQNYVEPAVDPQARPHAITWPGGIYEYNPRIDAHFANYLVTRRGFDDIDVPLFFAKWGLMVGRHGEYSSRIIIPYYSGSRVVYYTGRAITDTAEIRYKACKNDDAVIDPKELLFNADCVESPGGIILCEGPLDAIKATTYGPIPAVALGSNHVTPGQILQLKRARRIFLMLDNDYSNTGQRGALSEAALMVYAELIRNGVPTVIQPIPGGFKDLAAIPFQHFSHLITVETLTHARHS